MLSRLRLGIEHGGSIPIRGARTIRTSLRAAHILAFSAFYGGHVFGQTAESLLPALIAVLLSGFTFMAFEVWQTPVWLVQVRGVAAYLKFALVIGVSLFWEQRVEILTTVVVIGTVVSHSPDRYRDYSLLHRRVMGGSEKG